MTTVVKPVVSIDVDGTIEIETNGRVVVAPIGEVSPPDALVSKGIVGIGVIKLDWIINEGIMRLVEGRAKVVDKVDGSSAVVTTALGDNELERDGVTLDGAVPKPVLGSDAESDDTPIPVTEMGKETDGLNVVMPLARLVRDADVCDNSNEETLAGVSRSVVTIGDFNVIDVEPKETDIKLRLPVISAVRLVTVPKRAWLGTAVGELVEYTLEPPPPLTMNRLARSTSVVTPGTGVPSGVPELLKNVQVPSA